MGRNLLTPILREWGRDRLSMYHRLPGSVKDPLEVCGPVLKVKTVSIVVCVSPAKFSYTTIGMEWWRTGSRVFCQTV